MASNPNQMSARLGPLQNTAHPPGIAHPAGSHADKLLSCMYMVSLYRIAWTQKRKTLHN